MRSSMRTAVTRTFVLLGVLTLSGGVMGNESNPKPLAPELVCEVKVTKDSSGTQPLAANSEQSEPVWVRFTIRNRGNAPTPEAFRSEIFIVEDTTTIHSRPQSFKLDGGEAKQFGPVRILRKVNRNYRAITAVDVLFMHSEGSVKESNENNNRCSFEFKGPKLY